MSKEVSYYASTQANILGAVFGLLVGLVSTHEMLLGYRIPSYLGRVLRHALTYE